MTEAMPFLKKRYHFLILPGLYGEKFLFIQQGCGT